MRNKSEIIDNKCYSHIIKDYDRNYICKNCEYNQWQAGEIENKSKLDEAREYYKSCVKSSNDATYVYKEVGNLYDKYEFAIKELEDKIYELQGEVNDEANEVAKLKEKLKQQLKIDDDKIISLIMSVYNLYQRYFTTPPFIDVNGEVGLKSGDLKILREKLLDYFGVKDEN